jgi:hypothetical protein
MQKKIGAVTPPTHDGTLVTVTLAEANGAMSTPPRTPSTTWVRCRAAWSTAPAR